MTIKVVNHTDQAVHITNFSKERYLSRDYMSAEWDNLWRRTWLVAGLVSDVAEPGQFFVFDLGQEQILVSHTLEGEVQGFYNVCQHRGNRRLRQTPALSGYRQLPGEPDSIGQRMGRYPGTRRARQTNLCRRLRPQTVGAGPVAHR